MNRTRQFDPSYLEGAWPPGSQGTISQLTDPDNAIWAGQILLPNPEARRGWAIHNIYRAERTRKRQVGFRGRRVR